MHKTFDRLWPYAFWALLFGAVGFAFWYASKHTEARDEEWRQARAKAKAERSPPLSQ